MSDKVDDMDANPPPRAPTRTLKLKGPRVERPAPPKSLPAKMPPTGPFAGAADQVKRQMQADMDALAGPQPPCKKRP